MSKFQVGDVVQIAEDADKILMQMNGLMGVVVDLYRNTQWYAQILVQNDPYEGDGLYWYLFHKLILISRISG